MNRKMELERPCLAEKTFAVFFAFIPFAYAMQVSMRSPYAAALVYLPLIVGIMLWLSKESCYGAYKGRPSVLSIGFILLIIHHSVMCWVVAVPGDAGLVGRVLVLFTAPLILFWVARSMSLDGLELIIKVITLAALLVSIELIYESFSTQTFEKFSFFQLLNKAYVQEVLSLGEMGQLWWPGYRATGLIEHPHATALLCNIGFLMAALLFIYHNNKFYLVISLFCASAVFTQGFRVPVVSQLILVAMFAAIACLEASAVIRRQIFVFLSLYILMVICIYVIDPTKVVQRYYLTAAQGYFQLPNSMGVGSWVRFTAEDLIHQSYIAKFLEGDLGIWPQVLFGHGLLGSLSGRFPFSDDMFILALPFQYGIFGVMVFGTIWIVGIWTSIYAQIICRGLDVPMRLKMLSLISLFTVMTLALSLIHSAALQRKAIYPLFPFFIGACALTNRQYSYIRSRVSKPRLQVNLSRGRGIRSKSFCK